MKQKHLMILLSIIALVVSSFMIAGNVGAMYMTDGATQNGSTGGWNAPTDGICVLSIDMNGNMVTDPSITTARDCQARLIDVTAVTTGDTLANVCGNTTKNTAGVKYAAPGSSTCVTIDVSGYITGSKSMVNLDRNALMCNGLGGQLANATVGTLSNGAAITTATKTVANGTAAKCLAYGWQYRGQDATGAPLTFGATGVAQGSGTGYCYTTLNMTTAYATQAACPSNQAVVAPFNANAAYDWAWSSSKCTYAKGIAGYLNAALTKANGTTYAAGSYLDLSTFTSQGTCLANGGSWANWTGQAASTVAVATTPNPSTIPSWDYTRQAPDADRGCLHCHSYKSQHNGPAERFKDSYLLTGHKNMLRKVTPGMAWAGPDANGNLAIYTTDGTNSFNWTTGFLGANQAYYIYGDWMIPNPTAAIAGSNYGCANCHSTGFGNGTSAQSPAIPGVQSIGTPGYAGNQPADAGAGYVSAVKAGWKWDLEGIMCSRCHNAAVGPVNAAMIAASSFPTTAPTSGGMGALANGTGRNNLCFGCHQSMASSWPAGTAQFDPTLIPTGISHGAAAGREFNGHVLGNSFLNSVHARYAGAQSGNGSVTPNSLGEKDLTDPNGTSEYNSLFKGYTCWQSPASNSPGKTKADGTEIKTKTDCEAIYGAGSWRADQDGSGAATSIQGTCTTCHDVHNSLFVASQSEAAIRKSCTDCHVDNATISATDATAPQVVLSAINHPTGIGTPFDTTKYGNDACAVCHMATQAVQNGNQNSMPAHVWRINTDSTYSTFPSVGQFYGGTCSVHTGAVQNAPYVPVVYLSDLSTANCTAASGTWTAVNKDRNAQTAPEYNSNGSIQYATAVWVDIDMACGQCHGGSLGSTNTHNDAMYMDKGTLAGLAAGMHAGSSQTPLTASVNYSNDPNTSYLVNFDASGSSCSTAGQCVYQWSFGDGSLLATTTAAANTHTYANANTVSATMTIVDTTTQAKSSATISVTPTQILVAPTALNTVTQAGWSVIVQDNSQTGSTDAQNTLIVNVDCGNATKLTGVGGGALTCTYTTAGNYTIKETVTSAEGLSSSVVPNVTKSVPVKCTIAGTVTRLDGVTPVSGAVVYLKIGTATKYLAVTAANGTYSIPGVVPASYTETVTKSGLTFTNKAVDTTSSCPGSVNISSNQ